MEVHPPEHPIHTWRDFFIHIATIVAGLLIAICLEQSVEWLHHRHQRHTAEHNLSIEREQNLRTLAYDEKQLGASVRQFHLTMDAIAALRAHKEASHSMSMQWSWNDLTSSGWDTARATNVAALMPYEEAQRYADIYDQQAVVNEQSSEYIRDVYRVTGPLQMGRKPEELSPGDLDKMEAEVELAVTDANHLLDLCHSLDLMYKHEPPQGEQ